MRKLLLNLFLSTVGLLFAGQASAQKEIAPGIIKLQAGEIDTFTPYSLFGGKPAVEAMKQLPAAKPPFMNVLSSLQSKDNYFSTQKRSLLNSLCDG